MGTSEGRERERWKQMVLWKVEQKNITTEPQGKNGGGETGIDLREKAY